MKRVSDITFSEPLVSVAMVTYNHRPFIEHAVACVLAQEVDFGVELVIGEDCSTDGTREVVADLQRRFPAHIRVISADRNVGMHANLIRVERACRGRYLAYCEGDDAWHDPTKLAKQVAFLEARPDHVMVHSHCHRYFVAEKHLLQNDLTVPTGLDDARAYEDILLGRRSPLTVTVLVRRDKLNWVLDHCPECSDPKWPMGDTQRWLELSRLGKVGCLHDSLATTNMLPESAGQSRDPRRRLRFFLAARELQLRYLDKYPVAADVDHAVRARLALSLLNYAFEACDAEVAEKMYAEYVAAGKRPTWRMALLRWGSHTAFRRGLAIPFVKVARRWQRFQHRPGSVGA